MPWGAHDVLSSCLGKRGKKDGRQDFQLWLQQNDFDFVCIKYDISLEEELNTLNNPYLEAFVLFSTLGVIGGGVATVVLISTFYKAN